MPSLVTGATGLIGRRLVAQLGASTIVLSRDPTAAARTLKVEALPWDGTSPPRIDGFEAVFHLAGESIAEGRWTSEKKRRIRDSRVLGTRAMVAAFSNAKQRPRVLISASAVGFYGDRGDEVLTEKSAAGSGFLAEVCAEWEHEARAAEALGVRVVTVRTGVVLSPHGGALEKLVPLFRLGLGGALGDGAQWMSWVHVDDLVGLMLHAAQTDAISGPLNATAPTPVTNSDFTRALGHALHRPTIFSVPRLAMKLALGETSSVVLGSQRVMPQRALETGFSFRFSTLDGALADVLAKR